jgi:hypothetical protein
MHERNYTPPFNLNGYERLQLEIFSISEHTGQQMAIYLHQGETHTHTY